MQQKKKRQIGLCQIGYLFPNKSLIVEERTFKMNKKNFDNTFPLFKIQTDHNSLVRKQIPLFLGSKIDWGTELTFLKNDKAIIGGTYNVKI